MDQKFIGMLPPELQAVVAEAEDLAGCQVAVVRDEQATEFDNLELAVDRGGECSARIAYKASEITRCILVHEVLHLKRYWVDEVPVLRPAARRFEFEAQALEDLIEHLIIIPEEQRFVRAESNAHWQNILAAKLDELPALTSTSSEAEVVSLQRSLVQQRAMLDIALPEISNVELYARLRAENLFDASEAFVRNLHTVMHDKVRALSFVGEAFRYVPGGFLVGQFKLGERPRTFGAP